MKFWGLQPPTSTPSSTTPALILLLSPSENECVRGCSQGVPRHNADIFRDVFTAKLSTKANASNVKQ